MDEHGVPARELRDEQLEQQGARAHATRNWVFLHGTAEQFQRHTERMLELEQEYLRRHPKRTWQGAAGDEPIEVDEATRLRSAVRGLMTQMEALLSSGQEMTETPERDEQAEVSLLRVVAAAPEGRMHRLEVHQAARRAGLPRALLAQMYRAEPPLLRAEGHDRVITEAGRSRVGA
jgi:ribosomal protein S18 acetylase RimI-like enzyme